VRWLQPKKAKRLCQGKKVKWKTEFDAQLALGRSRAIIDRDPNGHIERRYYRCPRCSFFHLTSQEQRS
jgi:hypothetical protein